MSLVEKGKRADILQFTLVTLADLLNGVLRQIVYLIIDVQGFSTTVVELNILDPLLK